MCVYSPLPAKTGSSPRRSPTLSAPQVWDRSQVWVDLSGQFCCCVALDKSLYLPEPLFSSKNENNKRPGTWGHSALKGCPMNSGCVAGDRVICHLSP